MPDITATIANLDALAERATQGEWDFHQLQDKDVTYHMITANGEGVAQTECYNDAAFIVTLRNNYKAIRAQIQQQAEEIERLSKRAEAAERDMLFVADSNKGPCFVCAYNKSCTGGCCGHHFNWRGPQPAEEGKDDARP